MKIFNLLFYLILLILQLMLYANARECKSVVIISDLSNFDRLTNCTVIKGSLKIAFIRHHRNDMEVFNNMSFPLLREITDYFFLYMVEGLKSLQNLFPNLIVIRGRKLNLRYAFAIHDCPDLEEIGFNSLIAIQRGQALIDSNQKLCYSDKVSWRNVTKHPERNHLKYNTNHPEQCPGCPPGCTSCWGKNTCQHYDLENLLNPTYFYCNPQCIGGCWPDKQCATCRGLREKKLCVIKCSGSRLVSFDDMRCYTEQECRAEKKLLFKQDGKRECVTQCPPGFVNEYTSNGQRYSLINCAKCHILDKKCGKKICPGDTITYLEHLEFYRDCVKINGSLTIHLTDATTTDDLYPYLGAIEEISEYLQVYLSNHLTSLNFFLNLKLIKGRKLNHGHSLLIHHNQNLTELWQWKSKIENITLLRGGFYAHSNYKLCNYALREAEEYIKVKNKSLNHIFYNDDEVLCGSTIGALDYKVLSHNTISINWGKEFIYENLEVLWREFDKNYNLTIHSDVDEDVCLRNSWYRANIPHDQEILSGNKMFVNFNITNLKPNTVYGVVVKTFNNFNNLDSYKEAQSSLTYIATEPDLEPPPKINISSTDPHEIVFNWENYKYKSNFQDIYIEIFPDYDNATLLLTRDYLNFYYPLYTTDVKGTILTGNNIQECTEKEFEEFDEDDQFYEAIKNKFYCNLNSPNKCENQIPELKVTTENMQMIILTAANESKSLTVKKLKHYTNYIIKVSSCHKKICGAYYLDTIRTPPIEDKDYINEVNITAGWSSYQYYVTFLPPKDPNGFVISYSVEVAKYEDDNNSEDYTIYPNELNKIMQKKGIEITTNPNYLVRVKVLSLGAFTATSWYKVPPSGSSLTIEIIIAILVLISLVVIGFFIYKHRSRIIRCFRPPIEEQRVIFTAEDQNILIPTNDESISIDDGSGEPLSEIAEPLNRRGRRDRRVRN